MAVVTETYFTCDSDATLSLRAFVNQNNLVSIAMERHEGIHVIFTMDLNTISAFIDQLSELKSEIEESNGGLG